MWTSAKVLIKGMVIRWLKSLAGPLMAVIAIAAAIRQWTVPPRVWILASGALFVWAILQTFHEVRLEAQSNSDLFVGKWFHTIHDGKIQYQGKVLTAGGRKALHSAF